LFTEVPGETVRKVLTEPESRLYRWRIQANRL
jgi:hypothetical protein